jgi:hypothetical protein
MPRPMMVLVGESQPGQQVSPIREQNVAGGRPKRQSGGVVPHVARTLSVLADREHSRRAVLLWTRAGNGVVLPRRSVLGRMSEIAELSTPTRNPIGRFLPSRVNHRHSAGALEETSRLWMGRPTER